MVSFTSKKIKNENDLGKRLKNARESHGMEIEDVSTATCINGKYIAAFEDNDVDGMPEGIYAHKILKRYAEFLDLKIDKDPVFLMSRSDEQGQGELYQMKIEKDSVFKKIKDFILSPLFLRNGLVFLVALSGLVYLFSIAHNIIEAPELTIVSPVDDFVTVEWDVNIIGRTEKESKVFINDKEVFTEVNGDFNQIVDLKKGMNIFEISAKKKYSKKQVIYRKILVTGDDSIVAAK